MADEREFGQIAREFSSVARELGALNATVSELKVKVEKIDVKVDRHLENYTLTQYKIGKLAGVVALTTSLLLAFAKQVVALAFKT